MLLADIHLDLSMNALEWNRDLRQPVAALRKRERGEHDKPDRTRGTVSFPEMRRGRVGLVVATQIARYVGPGNPLPGWHSAEQAWAQTQGQLAWYREMEAAGELVAIESAEQLDAQIAAWEQPEPAAPIGYVRSLEGADSLVSVEYLERAVHDGLRAVGPAHYGPGRYAPGTMAAGPLEADGPALLAAMERLGVILDVTHLTDHGFWQALDLFGGAVWASHSNCRALVPHQRQLDDDQIRTLVARGAVIGASCDAWMIVPSWVRGQSMPAADSCTLERLSDHVLHVCALAGSTRHACIGSDLDGAFGTEQSPLEVDTIADLQRLGEILSHRGFTDDDVERFCWRNVVDFLRTHWAHREIPS